MKDERRAAARILLACVDPRVEPWMEEWERAAGDVDWPWLVQRARAHKLIGILCQRALSVGGETRLSETAKRELEEERQRGEEHRERVARTLRELQDLLGGLECPFLVVKGSVYSHDLYEDPTMRRFSDIDILIPHEKLEAVDDALKQARYFFWAHPKIHDNLPRWFRRQAPEGEEPGSQEAAKRILAEFHRHHLYVLRKDDPRMHVEVHWNVFVPGEGRASAEDLWAETRPTVLEGIEARTLGWEATLLHAAAHAMEQPPTEYRLLHLADVVWMVCRWRDVLDLQRLEHLAAAWGLGGYLTAALTVAGRVLPSGLPQEARSVWSRSKPLQAALLSAAGFGPWVAEPAVAEGRLRGMLENASREALWELALGRRPGTAWGRVSRAVQARLPGSSGKGSGREPASGSAGR